MNNAADAPTDERCHPIVVIEASIRHTPRLVFAIDARTSAFRMS
jgi:hypothetical protein